MYHADYILMLECVRMHIHTNIPTHFLCLFVGCSLCSLCQLGGMLTWLGWPFDEPEPSIAQTAANTVTTANK